MITLLSLLLACSDTKTEPVQPTTPAVTVDAKSLAPFGMLPADFFEEGKRGNDAVVTLGNRLFLDPKLSKSGKISCNSCHDLETNGADKVAFSLGHDGVPVGRNSPTVFNAAGHVAQFWDGRAATVEEQALVPILAAGEMAMTSGDALVKVLKNDDTYVAAFKAAFPDQKDPLTFENVGVAIGAFERTLVKQSRWDKFLGGDSNALGDDEKRGLNTFIEAGCAGCHNGALLGGNNFMKLGLVEPWPNQKDEGRFVITKKEGDRMVFKVPSLRYATETAPYFHDASATSLGEAINLMGQHQLGKELSPEQVLDIAAWLGSTIGPVE